MIKTFPFLLLSILINIFLLTSFYLYPPIPPEKLECLEYLNHRLKSSSFTISTQVLHCNYEFYGRRK